MQTRSGAFPRQHQKCTARLHKLPRRSERHHPSSIELASKRRKINPSQTLTVQQQTLRTRSVAQAMDDDYTGQSAQQQVEALRATAQTVLRGLDWADSQLTCFTLQAAASTAGMTTTSCKAHSIAAQQGPAVARGLCTCQTPPAHPSCPTPCIPETGATCGWGVGLHPISAVGQSRAVTARWCCGVKGDRNKGVAQWVRAAALRCQW